MSQGGICFQFSLEMRPIHQKSPRCSSLVQSTPLVSVCLVPICLFCFDVQKFVEDTLVFVLVVFLSPVVCFRVLYVQARSHRSFFFIKLLLFLGIVSGSSFYSPTLLSDVRHASPFDDPHEI